MDVSIVPKLPNNFERNSEVYYEGYTWTLLGMSEDGEIILCRQYDGFPEIFVKIEYVFYQDWHLINIK